MAKYSFKNIDLVNFLFLFLTPVASIILTVAWIWNDGFTWGPLVMGIIFYYLTGMSITAGYHRLFAHKAYEANAFVKFLFLIFGAATFQNSLLKWGSDHRLHHLEVDSEADPYSIQEGFFYAHMGWVFLKKNSEIKQRFAKDFLNDKLIMWQHRYYIPIAVIIGFGLPTLLGELFFGSWLGGLALAGVGRIVVVHHCTFFINSLCHTLGTTPYTDTNSAKDSWFMAILTFGEGYHNFHHYFQADYRNGIRWYDFDPTKWLIRSLSGVGMARKLKQTPQEKILAAKMQMKIKLLNSKITAHEKFQAEVEALKSKVMENWQNFQQVKNEYKATKAEELRMKMIEARREFDQTMEAWNHYLCYLQTCPIPVQ